MNANISNEFNFSEYHGTSKNETNFLNEVRKKMLKFCFCSILVSMTTGDA